jgi:hypothetical protein
LRDDEVALAPARLPFAPQPISTELLSSWLLRVAAANFVELSELLQGLQCRYGHVLTSAPMDYDLPAADVQALSQFCSPSSGSKNDATFSRQDILQIIAYLVLNAAPSSDRSIGRRRYARGLVLWPTLLKMIPAYEGKAMELAGRRWPVSLRQRFASALRYRTQRRWPHTPYRGTKNFCTRFKYSEVVAVYDLSAGKRSSAPKFTI